MTSQLPTRPEPNWSAARQWALSGAMGLGDDPDASPPVLPPAGLVHRLNELVQSVEVLTSDWGPAVDISWSAALAGRASLLNLHRPGRVSANGSCHLLEAPDGWVALNLARPDDLDLVPALVCDATTDPWSAVTEWVTRTPRTEVVSRSRMLGLAAAQLPSPNPPEEDIAWTVDRRWSSAEHHGSDRLRVVDLSSLWAGPVVARILAECGAAVTHIISTNRHEGSPVGSPFYQWIHSNDEVRVELDLRTTTGRGQAAELIDNADVVIEGSRPRALEQLGLGPHSRPDRSGRVWLSITGYGREYPGRDWVAFGDDAAIAGGLVGEDADARPLFCGDAIADPLTGLTGAVAVLESLAAGGGQLIDLAMSRAAASCVSLQERADAETDARAPIAVESDGRGGWVIRSGAETEAIRNRPLHTAWIAKRGSDRGRPRQRVAG